MPLNTVISHSVFFQVTLGAGATPISATSLVSNLIIIQNNTGHTTRVGDSTVTTGLGIVVTATPLVLGPFAINDADLSGLYIAGTQGDKIDVLVL